MGIFVVTCRVLVGAEPAPASVSEVLEQNRKLLERLDAQQKVIEELRAQVNAVARSNERHDEELRKLQANGDEVPPSAVTASRAPTGRSLIVSGLAGLAFFNSESRGRSPNAEFRVDEAKIFLEASVWKNVYFLTEIDLMLREQDEIYLGETYVDFERLGAGSGWGSALNARVGRMNIPFGEEYLVRDAVANPLISHSLADVWGIDEGVEIYGEAGKFQYIVAVQNGGHSVSRDYDSDKSVTARLSWDPLARLHLSASAMRTGDLSVKDEGKSEVWFADGVFIPLGSAVVTQSFSARLYELNATGRWRAGHVNVSLGRADYADDDRTAMNERRIDYGSLELVQTITGNLFGAARYGWMASEKGYPLAGHGARSRYLYSRALTEELWRLSLGVGYRFGPPLVVKAEYMFEEGSLIGGERREDENLFAAEIGVKF